MATYILKIGNLEFSTDAETEKEAKEKAHKIFLGNPDYYEVISVIPHDYNYDEYDDDPFYES